MGEDEWWNAWLGFVIHPSIPRVQMAAPKHVKVAAVLEDLINGVAMSAKAIEKARGRIQWATACCPLTKSMLQPFWAWKNNGTPIEGGPHVGLPPEGALHPSLRPVYSPFLPKSSWWGCSDASASVQGDAYVGGWCSGDPSKAEVFWFHSQIKPSMGIQRWQPPEANRGT